MATVLTTAAGLAVCLLLVAFVARHLGAFILLAGAWIAVSILAPQTGPALVRAVARTVEVAAEIIRGSILLGGVAVLLLVVLAAARLRRGWTLRHDPDPPPKLPRPIPAPPRALRAVASDVNVLPFVRPARRGRDRRAA